MLPRLKRTGAESAFGLAARARRVASAAFATSSMVLAGVAAAAPPDNASPLKSQFTTLDLASCTVLREHQDGNAWRCDGIPGYPIFIAEGDDRFFMSFGAKGQQSKAARQTIKAFNSPFRDKRNRATVEWRYTRKDSVDQPFAAIVRYFTSRDGAKGQVLVVTRISADEVCHMAYIDALATQSAIALARSAADELARTFDCRDEPRLLGGAGRSPL